MGDKSFLIKCIPEKLWKDYVETIPRTKSINTDLVQLIERRVKENKERV